jgi:Bacterial low temperature requirement A protein (LtrA)
VTGIAARRIHDAGQARHATWLELFFDLVVVVAVSRLGVRLHGDHSASGVAAFSGLLVVIWWIWISFSYFADLFDDDRVLDRTAQLLAMVGVAVAAWRCPGRERRRPRCSRPPTRPCSACWPPCTFTPGGASHGPVSCAAGTRSGR